MKRNKLKWTIISLGIATAAMLPTFVTSCGLGNSLGTKLPDKTWIPKNPDAGSGPQYNTTNTNQTQTYTISIFDNWNGVATHPEVPGLNPHFQNLLWATTSDFDSAFWSNNDPTSNSFKEFSQYANMKPVVDNLKSKGTKVGQIGNIQGNIQYYYQYTFDITFSQQASYFTLASKFAPGPDWFWGVSALQLYKSGWAFGSVKDLILYTTATADPRYTSGTIVDPKELNNTNDDGLTHNQKFGQIILTPKN